jgi:Holin of 3TMs, for gene-transfer release
MAEEQTVEKKKDEDWMQKKWRPAMGWMYMVVCFFDMVIFPILWALVQTIQHQQLVQWNPLTLQGAGLFHVAMGAVLGIAAFGRTQEKIAGTATNATPSTPAAPATTFPSAMPAAPSVPAAAFPAPSFGAAPAAAPAGFGAGFPGDPPTRNTRNDG